MSTRLEVLEPFPSHFGSSNSRGLELPPLKVLMRVRGKCTTDHISAAVRDGFLPLDIYSSVATGTLAEI